MIRNIGLVVLFLFLLYLLGMQIRKPATVSGPIHGISPRPVKELDALQTSSGALITAAMERQDSAGLDYVIFQLWHTSSESNFAKRTMLYNGRSRHFEAGEYQALFQGIDGRFHLLFCDGSDGSKAKHLTFSTSSGH